MSTSLSSLEIRIPVIIDKIDIRAFLFIYLFIWAIVEFLFLVSTISDVVSEYFLLWKYWTSIWDKQTLLLTFICIDIYVDRRTPAVYLNQKIIELYECRWNLLRFSYMSDKKVDLCTYADIFRIDYLEHKNDKCHYQCSSSSFLIFLD